MKRSELKRTPFRSEPKPSKGPRLRKCGICRKFFEPRNAWVKACNPECAETLGKQQTIKQKAKAAKAERAADKIKRDGMQKLEYWLKKAEKACNAYIRKRDEGQGCISCGRHDADMWNAGHFVSVGANGTLRYDEDNIHLQCARPCNKDKGGNIVEYRKALVKKIGVERVERLEGWHAPVKRTRADAEEIEAYYKAKLKSLKEVA